MIFNLSRRAGATAVSLVFAATAQGAGLIDDVAAVNAYRPALSLAVAGAAKGADSSPHIRAGGFTAELEKTLKEPSEKTRIVVYPKENSTNMLVLAAVVPPKGFEALPIAVCAQQNGKPLAAWNITAKGEVVSRPVVQNPEGSTKAACNAFIVAARAEVDQQLANTPPVPLASETPAVK